MIRWMLRFLGALLLWTVVSLPGLAQEKKFQPPILKPDMPPDTKASEERGPAVAEFAVALLITMLILTVVCMPSRKR